MKIKKVISTIKVFVPSNQAIPQPPLGPILAQNRIDINLFCRNFNEQTSYLSPGVILPVKIKRFSDKSQSIFYGPPTVSEMVYQLMQTNNKIVLDKQLIWDMLVLVKQFNTLGLKAVYDEKKIKMLAKTLLSSISSINLKKNEIK